MLETFVLTWLAGWAICALAAITVASVKQLRGTLTADDMFDTYARASVGAVWPLLLVGGVIAVVFVSLLRDREARVND